MCGEAAATEGTAATEGLCLECHSETATAVSADPLVSHDTNSFSFSAAPKRSHGHGNAAMLAAGLGAVKLKRAKPNPQLNTEYESSHASGSAPHDLFGGGGGSEVTERVAASRKRLIALRRSEADKEERGRAQAEDAVSRRQMQTSAWEQERSQEVDRLRAAAEAQVAQQQAARRLESDVMGHSPAGGVRSSARPYGRSNAPPPAASRALPGPAGRVSRGGGARGPRQGWATFVAGREVSQNKRSPEQKTAAVGSSAADGMLWRRGGWLAMLYHRSLPPFDAAPDGGRLDSCIRQVRGQAAAAAALRTQQVRHGLPQGGPPQKIASLCVMVTECGGQTTGADALLTLSDPTGSMQAIVDGGVLRQLADRQGLHPAAASLSVGVVLRLRQLSVVSPGSGAFQYLNIATARAIEDLYAPDDAVPATAMQAIASALRDPAAALKAYEPSTLAQQLPPPPPPQLQQQQLYQQYAGQWGSSPSTAREFKAPQAVRQPENPPPRQKGELVMDRQQAQATWAQAPQRDSSTSRGNWGAQPQPAGGMSRGGWGAQPQPRDPWAGKVRAGAAKEADRARRLEVAQRKRAELLARMQLQQQPKPQPPLQQQLLPAGAPLLDGLSAEDFDFADDF